MTARVEEVVLDLGLHGPFVEAAERFAVHHGGTISENLVRRVVDRVGRCALAHPDLGAQLRPAATTAPTTLVVQLDGSMLPTRGADPWREAKVGLVARADHIVANKGRGLITEARFVARLGDFAGFKQAVADALRLERADDSARVVVVGDGAAWVGRWRMNSARRPCRSSTTRMPAACGRGRADPLPSASGLDRLFVATVERELTASTG